MVDHLVKDCVQREGHDRMEAHRKEMERARRAKEEESKRAAEVERYKSLLKVLCCRVGASVRTNGFNPPPPPPPYTHTHTRTYTQTHLDTQVYCSAMLLPLWSRS